MTRKRTQSSRHFVGLADDKQVQSVVLVAELGVQGILESLESCILVTGNGEGCGLVARCVDFDFVLEGVVVEVVCDCEFN